MCWPSAMPPRRSQPANVSVALITLAGMPRTGPGPAGEGAFLTDPINPNVPYETAVQAGDRQSLRMCAKRHMHEFGTTTNSSPGEGGGFAPCPAQSACDAARRGDGRDVVNSPMVSDPLHRLDCCVISDGGGALIVVSPEVARDLNRPKIAVRGAAEAIKHLDGGEPTSPYSGGVWSGRRRSPKPASRQPTSSMSRSTTASPSPS